MKIDSTRRNVFLHMQKTAGSDIAAQFHKSRLGKYFFPEDLRATLAYLPSETLECYRFFYGHEYRRQEIRNIPGEKFLFTFLRDPIERLISHYEWLASYKLDIEKRIIPQPETIPVKTMSCDEFFQSAISDHILAFNNYYTRTIHDFFVDERTDDVERMLSVALEKLHVFDFIGLVDCYGASLDYLGRLLDIQFEDPAERPKINATLALPNENEFHEGGGRFNVCPETMSRILHRNKADIELYRHARRLAQEQFGLPEARILSGFSTQGVVHRGYSATRLYIDTEGYLQFGPYERLNAGDYIVTFELKFTQCLRAAPALDPDTIVATLDVVQSYGGDFELARRVVKWREINSERMTPFPLRVSTSMPIPCFECRVHSTGMCELEAPMSLKMENAADYRPDGAALGVTPP
ncbi:sulfotransferase family protein [Burkholderia sp. MSHR3999]|uniref:sulfotransferase family 2 domain-containing protein n=1 Tax=Burkholderia sp. MSHR3999 TaxID=1542965 RepID=UPI0005B70834|nr:sulfotransferase family 2 domain-containing protein [Burkholderia sp. MSHR3999]KIP17177.1 sulfotransferase family protein [Burkholderia sp. MSHR3999]